MQAKSIYVAVCAVVVGALMMSALSRGGPLNPPPGPIAPSGVTLADVDANVVAVKEILKDGAEGKAQAPHGNTMAKIAMEITTAVGTPPIVGEEIIGPFVDAIRVTSVSGGDRTTINPTLSDLVVVKELDKSSPKLQEAICNGTMFPSVKLHFLRTGATGLQEEYYLYELTNVIITSYSFSASQSAAGDPQPTENVTLNFAQVKVTYTPTADTHTTNKDGTCGPSA